MAQTGGADSLYASLRRPFCAAQAHPIMQGLRGKHAGAGYSDKVFDFERQFLSSARLISTAFQLLWEV